MCTSRSVVRTIPCPDPSQRGVALANGPRSYHNPWTSSHSPSSLLSGWASSAHQLTPRYLTGTDFHVDPGKLPCASLLPSPPHFQFYKTKIFLFGSICSGFDVLLSDSPHRNDHIDHLSSLHETSMWCTVCTSPSKVYRDMT